MDTIVFGIFILGAIIFSLALNHYRKKKVQAVADELGLEFLPKVDLLVELDGCDLFTGKGHGRKCFNCFGGNADGVTFKIFEYSYYTGIGKSQKTHSQTVAYMKLGHLVLPDFQITSKGFFSKIFSKPVNTIEVNDAEFSSKFWTCSTKALKLVSLFNPEVKQLLMEKGFSVESSNGRLLFYQHEKTVSHSKLKDFLTSSLELMMALEDATMNPINPFVATPVAGIEETSDNMQQAGGNRTDSGESNQRPFRANKNPFLQN